ncbi:MAG: hypothetical protein ACHQPH_07920 [Reyranellales bacterium]
MAASEYARWLAPGLYPDKPWSLSDLGRAEALRRQGFAPAAGQRLCKLWERRDEVLKEALRWCFGDPQWCLLLETLMKTGLRVSGVVGHGERLEIDELLLMRLHVDLQNDEAVTLDGRTTWQALAAGWPSGYIPVLRAEAFDASSELPSRAPATLQGAFADWYGAAYPDGHPVGKKHDDLAYEAARSLGRKVSARTVRRSLRDFRPRPSAAR